MTKGHYPRARSRWKRFRIACYHAVRGMPKKPEENMFGIGTCNLFLNSKSDPDNKAIVLAMRQNPCGQKLLLGIFCTVSPAFTFAPAQHFLQTGHGCFWYQFALFVFAGRAEGRRQEAARGRVVCRVSVDPPVLPLQDRSPYRFVH